jgi:hypothetical protein
MKKILPLLTLIIICFSGLAQQGKISGSIADTNGMKSLYRSTVMLIKTKDSTLANYTYTNEKGYFSIDNLTADTFKLQITRPGFADYEDEFILKENEHKNLGEIFMIGKAILLKQVIIREKLAAIRIKGDTTEYLVDSFLTNKNNTVEALLKKLPGIQVDKDGKITAQGQTVKKVLVDGEEFFGSDPTVATRNIKAENIEKVQVFDKKSDQAVLTGVDDGEKSKTINLTLKDDAKKGYFGKAKTAEGFQKQDNNLMYENELMFNSFNSKRKLSVYGAFTNTNKTGLDWEESDKYTGGAGQTEFTEGGGMITYYDGDDNDFNGVGIPETWYLGTYYSNKFKDNKHSINGNLKHKEINVNGFDNNYTKTILPDTLFYNRQNKNLHSRKISNNANANYEFKIDSLSFVRIKFDINQSNTENDNIFNSTNSNGLDSVVNSNERISRGTGLNQSLNSSVMYNKKFAKKGRSTNITLSQNYSNVESDNFINSITRYFNGDGSVKLKDSLDQKKTSYTTNQGYSLKTSYTEPLIKNWFAIGDYELIGINTKSGRSTLEKSNNAEYNTLIDTLSNQFKYDLVTNKGGLALKYGGKKLSVTLGAKVSFTNMLQNNLVNNTKRDTLFINYFPTATLNYKIKNSSNFNLNYYGSTRQPTLQQIQPLQDNSNPLDVFIGNPNLVQSFNNTVSLSYSSYKALTGNNIWSSFSFTQINNDFTSYDFVSNEGKKIHQTVNVEGNYNANMYMHYGLKIKKLNLYWSNSLNGNLSNNVNYINKLKNINTSQSLGYRASFYYDKDEKYSLNGYGSFNYTRSNTSLRPDVVTQFWIQSYGIDADWRIKKKWNLSGECNFNIRQQNSTFSNNLNTTIINLSIERYFLTDDKLSIELGVYDLLNQNLGFSRTANSNYINENTHTVLKQYFMLNITYNFKKQPKK